MWLQRYLDIGSWSSRKTTTCSCSLGGPGQVVINLGVTTITSKRGPGQTLGNTPEEEKASVEERGVSQQTQGSAIVGFTEDVFKGEGAVCLENHGELV